MGRGLGPGDDHQVERFGESFTNILKTWWGAFTLTPFFCSHEGWLGLKLGKEKTSFDFTVAYYSWENDHLIEFHLIESVDRKFLII